MTESLTDIKISAAAHEAEQVHIAGYVNYGVSSNLSDEKNTKRQERN